MGPSLAGPAAAGNVLADAGRVLASAGDLGVVGQFGPLDDPAVVRSVAQLLGFGVLAFAATVTVALVYRWYTREPVPAGVTALVGIAVVGLYLNTVGLFGAALTGTATRLFELETVVFNLGALVLAGLASPVGRVVGDRIATDVFAFAGARELDAEVSRLVRTVGRVTTVELPAAEDIDDIEGYDPVADEVKAEMGGKTLLLPRRLTVGELGDRIATRLRDDHGVGHVDIDIAPDGSVEYLGLGSRAAGIGPTLAPDTVALAIRADPPNGASAGDVVQVWDVPEAVAGTGSESGGGTTAESGDGTTVHSGDRAVAGGGQRAPRRVAIGEVRAVVGDVVTLAVDERDAGALDPSRTYRLLTLPVEPQADREFASLLRAADETMGVVRVAEGSQAVGDPIGTVDAAVVAVASEGETIEAIPTKSRTLAAGDTLYVVARPDALRRLEERLGEAPS